MLSASRELETGFRAAILLADDLFRLDVAVAGDTLRTVVRNLSGGEMIMDGQREPSGYGIALGEVAHREPCHTGLSFTVDGADGRVEVKVTLMTLRLAERGTTRVTAQALLRWA